MPVSGITFYARRSVECREVVAAWPYTAPKDEALRATLLDRAGAHCNDK